MRQGLLCGLRNLYPQGRLKVTLQQNDTWSHQKGQEYTFPKDADRYKDDYYIMESLSIFGEQEQRYICRRCPMNLTTALYQRRGSQAALVVKNLPANPRNVRDSGSIPGSGQSPGGGHGNVLQCSCLENLMDTGGWQPMVHRVAKSWT